MVRNLPAMRASIPGSGRYAGGRNNNPLQYSFLGNLMVGEPMAGYSPWGCKESDNPLQYSFLGNPMDRGAYGRL